MQLRAPARLAASAALALSVTAGVAVTTAPAASAAQMPCKARVYYEVYQANGVNFRTGPSTGYASKGSLYKHDWGKKIATKSGWIKLQLGQKSRSGLAKGSTGWIASKYLSDCVPMQLD
ncbi:SH3 domain-containing protein [Streptomyces sp. NPDC102441]|uniref:SH3 domain-containing protein n=1 Tax=Streptomyces sp. NPDC102441 TaxID=3366176 RepID=UPI00380120D8